MPKGFSEREKTIIREQLLEKGRELFQIYGMRKTSVQDLTSAVGISKGAFYHFYNSKEELFLEILERFEAEYQEHILGYEIDPALSPRQNFHAMMRRALTEWETNPLFSKLDRDEYTQLLRKLPPDALQGHVQSDDVFMARVIHKLAQEGIYLNADPPTAAGLMKALFFVQLHKGDFGDGVYPGLVELMLGLVTNYLVQKE